MEEILLFATVLAPIVIALVELVKKTTGIKANLLPITALVIGLLIGLVATPFSDLETVFRLWAGGIAGLSAVGLFEAGARVKKAVEDKE